MWDEITYPFLNFTGHKVISSHTLPGRWLLIHAGIKVNPYLLNGPLSTIFVLVIPSTSTNVKGEYSGFTLSVCLPVRLSSESCPLCIFHNASWIHIIFTHITNLFQNFWQFFYKIAALTLTCVHIIWMSMLIPDLSFFLLQPLLISYDDTSRWFTEQKCPVRIFKHIAFHL